MPHMCVYVHHHRKSRVNQWMGGWLVHFEGRLDVGWQLEGLHRLLPPAANGDDDDTYTCARRQRATDQREDATILIDASAL